MVSNRHAFDVIDGSVVGTPQTLERRAPCNAFPQRRLCLVECDQPLHPLGRSFGLGTEARTGPFIGEFDRAVACEHADRQAEVGVQVFDVLLLSSDRVFRIRQFAHFRPQLRHHAFEGCA